MKILTLIVCFFSTYARAEAPLAFEKISTKYVLDQNIKYPSCLVVKHRAVERAKVLREMEHQYKSEPQYQGSFFKDYYLMNKYFLDMDIWRDEVVTIKNVWKMSDQFSIQAKNEKSDLFLWLKGDGIDWIERIEYFPEEIQFEFNWDKAELVSTHKTYYIDYCFPRKDSQLMWSSKRFDHIESTGKAIEELLTNTKGDTL